MFSSLRSRLWLSYALLIVTALGVVAIFVFVYLLRNPLLNRQTLERLRAVGAVITQRENSIRAQSFSSLAEQASRTFNVRILQYSQDEQLLLDTYADREAALSFPQKNLLSRTLPLVRDASGKAWLYSRERLADNTFLVVAVPRPRITILNIIRDDLLLPIFLGGMVALVLSLFLAFMIARWIADPLQKVVLAARDMPSEQARPVDERGPHEVQELTRSFNAMMARVQSSQKSQREFVANVSHELKTPLTSIQGFSQAILDGTADLPEERRQAAQVIYDESARMHRLVLDLLDLARLDGGIADITMSPVNLADLLIAVAEKFAPQSQKAGVNIKLDIPSNLPQISADGDRLMQVFTNLVDNALKFTPRGGSITLHASLALNGQLYSYVMDTGYGIPPEKQAHIFERFYQADPARRGGNKHGAGLGLAIAREIIQAHGGKITVRSGPGMGTTFEMFLPLTQISRTARTGRK